MTLSSKIAFTEEGYLSFEEIHDLLGPSVSVAHYLLVNQVQSFRIRLVLARLGIYIYIYRIGRNIYMDRSYMSGKRSTENQPSSAAFFRPTLYVRSAQNT